MMRADEDRSCLKCKGQCVSLSDYTLGWRFGHVLIMVQVQGVNFRSFTEDKARSLNLTGFVKNAEDGKVVGEAQGEQSALDKFVQHLNLGPRAAKVSKVDEKEIATKNDEDDFDQ